MRIQHNIAALNSYRNLTTNNSAVSKNLEKLSSGYRINRAGDDAAGLAISEKMRAQITGLKTAQKNANDGISLVQTAEGAMTEIHSMLNRMVELADQSANGTYADAVDRENLQKEIASLKDEINRIADSTNFNGINLLDGSLDGGAIEAASYDATGKLPAVGKVLGTDTVLHTEAGQSADETTFSMDFHNTKISGAKGTEFTLKVGDVTLTGTLAKDFAEGAELDGAKIVDALANGTTTNVSFKIGADAYDPTNFTVNGAKFEADTASTGTRITFKSDESVNPDMKVSIALSDKDAPAAVDPATGSRADGTAAGTAPTVTVTGTPTVSGVADGNGTTDAAKFEVDFTGVSLGAEGTMTLTIDDMTITSSKVTEANKADASKIAAAFNGKTVTYGGQTFTAAVAGNKVTFTAGTNTALTGKAPADIKDPTLTAAGDAAAATQGTYTLDFTGKTGGDVIGKTITVGDKTYEFVKTGGTAATGNVKVDVAEDADDEDIVDAFVTAATASKDAKVGTVAEDTAKKVKLTAAATAGADSVIPEVTMDKGNTPDAPKLSGDYNVSTTVLQKKADGAGERLASTYFDLTKEMAGNGSSVKIGKTTYTFTTDAADKAMINADNSTNNKVYVGDLDLNTKEGMITAAERLSNVAKNNDTYTVGHDGKRMTFTEKVGQTSFKDGNKSTLDTLENIEKSFGFKVAAQEADSTKGLTLQIGDTSDDFNKLTVSVKDMHTTAMGIGDVDVSTQANAAKAVDKIKDAINYVSSTRGDLGAIQNRLEHTINNLSVTTENMTAAESRIRDVDMAEEMMAYTKNNILVQASQAMLAQANQIPQGVLQLLQ